MINAKFILAALAATVVGGTTALAHGDIEGGANPLATGSPTPEASPSATPTPEAEEHVPNGKAYGWWRNHGVLLEKPGNGPKAKDRSDEESDSDDSDDGDVGIQGGKHHAHGHHR